MGLSAVAASLGELGKAVGALERVADLVAPTSGGGSTEAEAATATTEAAATATTEAAASSGASSSSGGTGDATHAAVPSTSGRVEMRDVWFRYPGAQDWAVRGLTLTLEAGQTLALVGPSGGGKSTIAALMLGLYTPQRGTIWVDGQRLQPQPGGGTGSSALGMAAVLQEPMLMSGTVRDQIRCGGGEQGCSAQGGGWGTGQCTAAPPVLAPT